MRVLTLWAIACLSTLSVTSAHAEVIEVTPSGFSLETSVVVDAGPADAYNVLVRPSLWWDQSHTYSQNNSNLSIEPKAGGCFCEMLGDGGSVEHAHVVFASPSKMLRLNGAFGPLQADGVAGALTWELSAEGTGTRLTQTYVAGGFVRMGPDEMAKLLDPIFTGQADHFKSYMDAHKR